MVGCIINGETHKKKYFLMLKNVSIDFYQCWTLILSILRYYEFWVGILIWIEEITVDNKIYNNRMGRVSCYIS